MAITELVDYCPIGFKLTEAAWCAVGAIFVANWRMRYWNVPVFALLVTNTFGYALISILIIFISLTEKRRYFVCVIFTGLGSALNFLAATLMVLRILVFKEPEEVDGGKPYYYVSEGLLAFLMYMCAITMLLDVICNTQPTVIETHSSTEEEDEDEDGVRTRSQHTETI